MSEEKSQEVTKDNDDDCVSDTLQTPGPPSSPCPLRSAAVKARERVSEWNKILQGLEDVTD